MTVATANQVVDKLRYDGLDSRIEHDPIPGGHIHTTKGIESWYLNPMVFKSLIKRKLIVKVGTRAGFDVYDLKERVER